MPRIAWFVAVSLSVSPALADTYVGLGVQAGAADDEAMFGASVDVDVRLWRWVWMHAAGAYGSVPALLGGFEDGTYHQGYAGIAAHGCTYDNPGMCGFIGVDAGARRLTPALEMTTVDALVVPRVGLDLGGDGPRFRPVLAIPVTRDGDAGWTLTASAAFPL